METDSTGPPTRKAPRCPNTSSWLKRGEAWGPHFSAQPPIILRSGGGGHPGNEEGLGNLEPALCSHGLNEAGKRMPSLSPLTIAREDFPRRHQT